MASLIDTKAAVDYVGIRLLTEQTTYQRRVLDVLTARAFETMTDEQRSNVRAMFRKGEFDSDHGHCYLAGQQTVAVLALAFYPEEVAIQMYANALLRSSGQEAVFPVSDYCMHKI